MAFVVKNGLQNFADKLKNYKAKDDLAEKVAEKVTNKGIEIAQRNWGNQANVVQRGNGLIRSIVAVDNNKLKPSIAYTEFGTGVQGKGTYEGDLPEQTITFETKDLGTLSTQGWQYNYRKDYLQLKGAKDFKGRVAEMPMFNTAKELREYIKTDLAKDIRKGD